MPIVKNPILEIFLFYYKRLYWLGYCHTSDRANPADCQLKGYLFAVYRIWCWEGISTIFTSINVTFIMYKSTLIWLAVPDFNTLTSVWLLLHLEADSIPAGFYGRLWWIMNGYESKETDFSPLQSILTAILGGTELYIKKQSLA